MNSTNNQPPKRKPRSLKFKITVTILVLVFICALAFVLNLARLLTEMHITNKYTLKQPLNNLYCLAGCCDHDDDLILDELKEIDKLQTKEERLEFIKDWLGVKRINGIVHQELLSYAKGCQRWHPNENLWVYPYD